MPQRCVQFLETKNFTYRFLPSRDILLADIAPHLTRHLSQQPQIKHLALLFFACIKIGLAISSLVRLKETEFSISPLHRVTVDRGEGWSRRNSRLSRTLFFCLKIYTPLSSSWYYFQLGLCKIVLACWFACHDIKGRVLQGVPVTLIKSFSSSLDALRQSAKESWVSCTVVEVFGRCPEW